MRYRVRYSTWSGEFLPTILWGKSEAYREFVMAMVFMKHLRWVTLEKFNFWKWKWEVVVTYTFKENKWN